MDSPSATALRRLVSYRPDDHAAVLDAWRATSDDVGAAYADWCASSRPDAGLAYGAYIAAMDREAAAARRYEQVCRRTVHVAAG